MRFIIEPGKGTICNREKAFKNLGVVIPQKDYPESVWGDEEARMLENTDYGEVVELVDIWRRKDMVDGAKLPFYVGKGLFHHLLEANHVELLTENENKLS